jgi:hypothetical protein
MTKNDSVKDSQDLSQTEKDGDSVECPDLLPDCVDDFQNFIPIEKDGDSVECRRLLPVKKLVNRLTFHEVTVFDVTLDMLGDEIEDQEGESGEKSTSYQYRLALPLALITRPLADVLSPISQAGDKVVFTDGTYLPSTKAKELAKRIAPGSVKVDGKSPVNVGNVSIKNKKYKITSKIRDRLIREGAAYARRLDNGLLERLILDDVEELIIKDFEQLAKKGLTGIKGDNRKVELSDHEISLLKQGGIARAKFLNGQPVRLKTIKSISKSFSQMMRWPQTPSEFDEFMRNLPGDPKELNPDEFCHALNGLNHIKDTLEIKHTTLAFEALSEALATYNSDPRAKTCKKQTKATRLPLPRHEIALLTTYRQDWELLGYSRGALLKSTTLYPNEEIEIEIFSWDRMSIEEEEQFGTEYETNLELNRLTRNSARIGREVSEQIGANAGINAGVSLPVKAVTVDAKGNAGVSTQVQNGLETTVEAIAETTRRASEKFKATHQVKIKEKREIGTETRTTRRIKNENASRTLTLHHFEVMENFCVTTNIDNTKRWCLLVENPALQIVDIKNIVAYEYRLQKVLLSPNYRSGFEAARKILAQQWFDESRAKAEQKNANLLIDNISTDGTQSNNRQSGVKLIGVYSTAKSILDILKKFFELAEDIDEQVAKLSAFQFPGAEYEMSPAGVRKAETSVARFSYWTKMQMAFPGFHEAAQTYVDAVEGLFARAGNESEILHHLSLLVDRLDDDWLSALKMFAAAAVVGQVMSFVTSAALTALVGPVAAFIIVNGGYAILSVYFTAIALRHDDMGLASQLSKAKRQLISTEAAQEVSTITAPVDSNNETTREPAEPGEVPPVPTLYSDRELAEAHADFKKLAEHLASHSTYYQNEIWRVEDANERLLRLQQMGVAYFVENHLLGFAGRKAIYPLRVETLPEDVKTSLKNDYANFYEGKVCVPGPETISLPTGGIYSESVVGNCDGLEPYLIERRAVDLKLRKAQAQLAKTQADQAEEELRRRRMRLDQDPPLLDSPNTLSQPRISAVASGGNNS